jgi:hypothetical protein
MHFMNPVPLMKLVEVIRGLSTSDETFETTKDLAIKLKKTPVAANDSPGFISNRILLPMINEAIFALHESVGTTEDIDLVMKLGMNHPMGPLELADLIGLDTCLSILEVLYEGFGDPLFPEMAIVRQELHAEKIEDIPAAVGNALQPLQLDSLTKPGASVAVAVGSRGISHIAVIISECVKSLTDSGLEPFIVPAMGSHGGNTPEGESSVLARLGITESSVSAPILAAEDVVKIGTLDIGVPILMDKRAAEADHIVVINRVKPHTKFHGPIESGLTKILTVGLGKGEGAAGKGKEQLCITGLPSSTLLASCKTPPKTSWKTTQSSLDLPYLKTVTGMSLDSVP